MTDKLRAAAEMALEALEFSQKMGRSYEIREYHNEIAPQAMYALRQALAKPPNYTTDVVTSAPPLYIPLWTVNADGKRQLVLQQNRIPSADTKLYAAPPKREWQGLTDEEIEEGYEQSWVESKQAWESAVWWAEAKLKDKNT